MYCTGLKKFRLDARMIAERAVLERGYSISQDRMNSRDNNLPASLNPVL